MARRRAAAAPPAAAAGDLWRQQQQLAALAAALQQLPSGDALPLVLLRGAQQALACVEHTLHRLPGGGDDPAAGSLLHPRNDVLGDDCHGGSGGSGNDTHSGSVVAIDARTAEDAEMRGKLEVVSEGVSGRGQARERAPGGQCRERLAVEKAVGILQGVLASVPAAASGSRDDGSGSSGDWDSSSFTIALLHSYIALSSDLFDKEDAAGVQGAEEESTACETSSIAAAAVAATTTGGVSSWRGLWQDELAFAARLTLPAGIYALIVAAMGWEIQLIELLGWLPDPWVASVALARVVELCPALAPGLVAALFGNARSSGSGSSPRAPQLPNRMSAAQQEPDWLVFCSSTLVHHLVYSQGLVLRVAEAVRQAAMTACGGAAETDGRRWLPCLLLLGRALVNAMHRHVAAAGVAVAAMAAAGEWDEDVTWADTCCEALQEGLCVWQEAVLQTDAVATVAGIESTAPTATALKQLLQGELKYLLDMQPGTAGGIGSGAGRPEGQQCLLSYAAVVRLRTRIALLSMQTASAAAPATPQPQPGSKDPASAAAVGGDIDETNVAADATAADHPTPHLNWVPATWKFAELTADDVWVGLDLPYGSTAGGLTGESGGFVNTPDATGGRAGKARVLLPQEPGVGSEKASPWAPAGHKQRLPEWLKAATASIASPPHVRRAGSAGGLQLLANAAAAAGFRLAPAPFSPSHFLPSKAMELPIRNLEVGNATGCVAAIAVALLTPGVGSWLFAQRDPRVVSAGDPDPYSPFRVALALLELLQGRLCTGCWKDLDIRSGPEDAESWAVAAAVASDRAVRDTRIAAQDLPMGSRRSGFGVAAEEVRLQRQLELRLMQMAAECLACVGAPGQQAALQAIVLGTRLFRSLRMRLAADASLQAAAGRALVTLSNRAVAVEGSLERRALSAQQEAQRLAAAATNLLPYTVLVPEVCIRRLVLDGLTHPGQQQWVLQLLQCFAVATGSSAAVTEAPVLLSCLQEVVLQDAQRWMRTSADRRSLVTLLGGLMETGLVLPRQLLQVLVERGLAPGGANGAIRSRSTAQIQCAMLVAQFVFGAGAGGGVSDVPCAGSFYNPAAELAAARPARLLLAAAAAQRELHDAYLEGHQLEAVAIDATAMVLERAVQLYGNYLCARGIGGGGDAAARVVADPRGGDACELRELAAGCTSLPRYLVAVMLPLMELSAAAAAASSQNSSPGVESAECDDGDAGAGSRCRVLAAMLVPPATWRPRSLRSASTDFARAAVHDTLCFAASSSSNAAAVQRALLDVAAAAATEEEVEDEDAQVTDNSGKSSAAGVLHSAWSSWIEAVSYDDGTLAAAAAAAQPSRHGVGAEGVVGRHVAATVARGMPQLPVARFLEGSIGALGALLPTASPEQARRLLLGLLPALVRAVGGAAVLHAAATGGRSGGGAATTAMGATGFAQDGGRAASFEVIETWLLGTPARRGSASPAADVAVSMVMACRGATAALRSTPVAQAPASSKTAAGCLEAEETAQQPAAAAPPLPPSSPSLRLAVADRCAAHMALLASRLASTAAAASPPPQLPAAPAPGPPAAQLPKAGATSLEVAVVALVLLSELCGLATVAAELVDAHALVTWQAILLSVLQCFVSALAALKERHQRHQQHQQSSQSVDSMSTAIAATRVGQLLSGVRRALCTLPCPMADVLLSSLDRLCEE